MKLRVKLVPSDDGTVVVVQYKWLGLIWRDYYPASNKVHKLQIELMDTYAKIHRIIRQIDEAEAEVKQLVSSVHRYGNRLQGVGQPFHDNDAAKKRRLPVFIKEEPFLAPPPAADYKRIRKAIDEGSYKDPRDFGVPWPPEGGRPITGGTRSAYIPERLKNVLIANGLVREGKDADHIIGYRKPEQNQKQNSQQGKRNKGGNPNQGNQGGNQ